MHQQCWCFGFDIRRQIEGKRANLLLELGFEHTPPRDGHTGAIMYQHREPGGDIVTLWSLGMCFGDAAGGVFVSRFSFWPHLGEVVAPEVAHSPAHLAGFRAARRLHECERALCYFARALLWLAKYEREVGRLVGFEHRELALKEWRHAASAPEAIPCQWEHLAKRSQERRDFGSEKTTAPTKSNGTPLANPSGTKRATLRRLRINSKSRLLQRRLQFKRK